MNDEIPSIQITPYAILAAILFNIGKTEKITVKADDSDKEIEVDAPCVGLVSEGDALVCMMEMKKIMHFAQTAYQFQFSVDNGYGIISFEKKQNAQSLYSADGKPLLQESSIIKDLIERLK